MITDISAQRRVNAFGGAKRRCGRGRTPVLAVLVPLAVLLIAASTTRAQTQDGPGRPPIPPPKPQLSASAQATQTQPEDQQAGAIVLPPVKPSPGTAPSQQASVPRDTPEQPDTEGATGTPAAGAASSDALPEERPAPPAPPSDQEAALPSAPATQLPEAKTTPELPEVVTTPEPIELPKEQPVEQTAEAAPTPLPAPKEEAPPQEASDQKPRTEVAALPEPEETGPLAEVLFETGSAELNASGRKALDSVAKALKQDAEARIQLLAYAPATGDSPSRARRLSLSRALAVRSYLIDQGVRSLRIDVRALGSNSQGGAPDRVDVVPARP